MKKSLEVRRHTWLIWTGLGGVALGLVLVAVLLQRQGYQLDKAELALLGKVSAPVESIEQTEAAFRYGYAEAKSGAASVKQAVAGAGAADSTGEQPYEVTLPKDLGDGIEFGVRKSGLNFKLVPLHKVARGAAKDGRVVYPEGSRTHVYTFKRNGIKEDIILKRAPGPVARYSWRLEAGSELEAKLLPDGSVGLYTASPYLYDNIQVADEKSGKLVENAKRNGEKTHMAFVLPRPYLVDADRRKHYDDVSFTLKDKVLTLEARNLRNHKYPLSIDPTITVTTTADFQSGRDDGMIDYSTANEVRRAATSAGTVGSWALNGNYLLEERESPAAVAHNGYLYVSGGRKSTSTAACRDSGLSQYCNDVIYASINSDGSLGAFNPAAGGGRYFSDARSGHGMVISQNYLYILGGTHATSDTACKNTGVSQAQCNDVQYAPINADGTVGAFATTSYFATPRNTFGVAAHNGYLYIAGGSVASGTACKDAGSSTVCNDVQYAAVNPDGTVSAWTNSAYFTAPRAAPAIVAHNGYLYITGGYLSASSTACKDAGTSNTCNDVQFAALNTNGAAGTWANAGYFGISRYGHAVAVLNGYFYIYGGAQFSSNTSCKNAGTSEVCNDTQYATINGDGTVGTFALTNYFTEPRTGSGFASYNGRIYLLGGTKVASSAACRSSGSDVRCNDVQYATIDAGSTSGTGLTGTFAANATHLSTARSLHATVAYNGYLYVIGGTIGAASTACKDTGNNASCNDVQYASINEDGTVGSFTTDTSSYFQYPRSAHTAVAYNNFLYVIGGNKQGSDTNCKTSGTATHCSDVQYAPINSDGSLGAFTTNANHFNFPRYGHASVVYNGYLYVAGGAQMTFSANCKASGSNSLCSDVQYAPLNANGSVGAFTNNPNYFSFPRYYPAVTAYNGYLYVAGGNAGVADASCKTGGSEAVCSDVQYAQINGNGSVGTFTTNANYITTPRERLVLAAANGYMYVATGLYEVATPTTACKSSGSSDVCSDVQYAAINSNGSLGAFNLSTNLTIARGGAAGAFYNGYLYITGGQQATSDTNCKSTGTSNQCSEVQRAGLKSIPLRASLERTVDLGFEGSLANIQYNGTACSASIMYRTAGAAGTYGAASQFTVAPGAWYTVGAANTQYVWLRLIMSDETCGTQTAITDIALTAQAPPGVPVLSLPASGATGISTTPEFRLASTESDGDYLRYRIQVCSVSDCSNVVRTIDQTLSQTGWLAQSLQGATAYMGDPADSQMAVHQYQTPALSAGTQYWWRAQAIDPGGTNTWTALSGITTFTTAAGATSELEVKGGLQLRGGTRIGN